MNLPYFAMAPLVCTPLTPLLPVSLGAMLLMIAKKNLSKWSVEFWCDSFGPCRDRAKTRDFCRFISDFSFFGACREKASR